MCRQAEESLVATLRQSCIAPGSTFPWSPEECRQFLNTLAGFRSITSDDVLAERMSCVARLSAEISRGRHVHGYGITNARLDRSQGIEGYLSRRISWSLTFTLGEVLVLGHSRHLLRRMTELWNGRAVSQRHWKPFLDDMRKEWMQITNSQRQFGLPSSSSLHLAKHALKSGFQQLLESSLGSVGLKTSSTAFAPYPLCSLSREH